MLKQIISELKRLEGKNDSIFLQTYVSAIKETSPQIDNIINDLYSQILDNKKLVTEITSPELVYYVINYINEKNKQNGEGK